MLTMCRLIALVALCAQALAQGQGQGQAEDDSPDLTHAEWNQLDALYAHFGRLSHDVHLDWFTSSDPCEWGTIECDEQGKMGMGIAIQNPNELRADTPVIYALSNVNEVTLELKDKEYPEVDLAYIARLFPNLQKLTIGCRWNVKSFTNLGALAQMPLEEVRIWSVGRPFPLAEWLPRMEHLKTLTLSRVVLDGERPELDLRDLIPPSLEHFRIYFQDSQPAVARVLLSDDMITAREQADGSVIHPLRLYFRPASKFLSFEMECHTLDPDSRPIESERERPDGIHPLIIEYSREPAPEIAGRQISKFAVVQSIDQR